MSADESEQTPIEEGVIEDLNIPFREAFAKLASAGGSWRSTKEIGETKVHSMANIRYGQDSEDQTLDIYFPLDSIEGDTKETTPALKPVFIHIHGGGWSRGSKDNFFYGGPAMSQNAASFGCIAVAPGYRLGMYPEFVHDAAAAIQWVRDNIEEIGGDINQVFLSGHSAGGHIASLLVLRHASFLEPLGITKDFFKGLVLVSGVYDLFSPLKTSLLDAKNKWFNLAYVYPAFGTDEQLKRKASPLLLLEPNKDTSVWGTAVRYIMRRSSSADDVHDTEAEEEPNAEFTSTVEINTTNLPSTLIMNATFDMGLQENGELMAAAMEKYTDVKYVLVSGTDHASICWNATAALEIKDFCLSKLSCAKETQK